MGYNEPKKALDFSVHFGKSSSVGQVDWGRIQKGGKPVDPGGPMELGTAIDVRTGV